MDANDELLTQAGNPSHLQQFMDACGLLNTMTAAYPNSKLPSTYKWGKRCLDYILISASLETYIRACGILPLHSGIRTDHRISFADIDLSYFLGHYLPDPIAALPRILKSTSINKWKNYKELLIAYYTQHKVLERAESFTTNIKNSTTQEQKLFWIKKFDDLDKEKTNYQLQAEAKTEPNKMIKPKPWSPTLMQAHSIVRYWEARLSLHEMDLPLDDTFLQQGKELGIDDLEIQGQEESTLLYITDQLEVAKQRGKRTIKEAPELRDRHLKEMGEYYESIGKRTEEKVVKNIRRYEKIRNHHAKHGSVLKPRKTGMLRYILSPTPDGEWEHITDPVEIFRHILHKNTHHLFKSHKSAFTTGSIANDIGPYGDHPIVEDILQGTYKIGTEYLQRQDYRELTTFIKALRYATLPNGQQIPQTTAQYTQEVYQKGFNGMKEHTASSPSKVHMGHQKAAAEDDFLAKTNAIFVNTPFQHGFSLSRWENSLHCMLQKKEQPWITKLRIIQLFEADFNSGLKFFFSKTMMRHCEKYQVMSNMNHGSKPARTVHDPLLIQTLHYDLVRITRTPFSTIFNDADGCYDRIPGNLLSITCQRRGLPKNNVISPVKTTAKMKHFIRTAYGISIEYIEAHIL